MNLKSIDKFFIVPRNEIYYINFIIESYEHIGFITTMDKYKAIVKITISPFFIEEFNNIINSISKEITITEIQP